MKLGFSLTDEEYDHIKLICLKSFIMFKLFDSNGASLGVNHYIFIINPHLHQSDTKAPI